MRPKKEPKSPPRKGRPATKNKSQEDLRRINGRIHYLVPEISQSEMGQYYSCDTVTIKGFDWWIEIAKEKSESSGKDCLSFWVVCKCTDSESKDWKCSAELEFRLLPQNGDETKVISFSHTEVLTPESATCGFYDFEKWKFIRDTRNGFCLNDSISLEVIVREMIVFTVVSDLILDYKRSLRLNEQTGLFDQTAIYDMGQTFPSSSGREADVLLCFREFEILAHAVVLTKSLFFRTRLQTRDPCVTTVKLPDGMDLQSLLTILTFLYTDKLVIRPDSLSDLIVTGSQMSFDAIVSTCMMQMRPSDTLSVLIKTDEVQEACERKSSHWSHRLMRRVWPLFRKKACHVLYSRRFVDISHSLLKKILIQEGKMSCDELDLLLRSIDWSIAECQRKRLNSSDANIRSGLKQAFYSIRFPCMKIRHLNRIKKKYPVILSDDEWDAVFQFAKKGKISSKLLFPTISRSSAKK